jgi:hypothetical protein
MTIDSMRFGSAMKDLEEWPELVAAHPELIAFSRALNASPMIRPTDQAVLHVWSGVESLFPSVTSELSFKVALYLAQLQVERESRRFIFDQARRGYKVRSSITHGNRPNITPEQWRDAWDLAMATLRAILRRGSLPTEEELIDGLMPQ